MCLTMYFVMFLLVLSICERVKKVHAAMGPEKWGSSSETHVHRRQLTTTPGGALPGLSVTSGAPTLGLWIEFSAFVPEHSAVRRSTAFDMSRTLAGRAPSPAMMHLRRGCAPEPAGPAASSQSTPARPGVAAPALPGLTPAASAAAASRNAAKPARRTSIVPLAAAADPATTPKPEDGLVGVF